ARAAARRRTRGAARHRARSRPWPPARRAGGGKLRGRSDKRRPSRGVRPAPTGKSRREMTIVDLAVYKDGKREDGVPLDNAFEAGREPGALVWIGLHEPTENEFDAVRREFGLHELAVEDAMKGHQRPKLEVYGDDQLFMVLKT